MTNRVNQRASYSFLFPLGLFAACTLLFCDATVPPDGEPRVSDPVPPGAPPSDAIVLFDGRDLDRWKSESGGLAKWKVENGYMEVNGSGNILTKEEFGDVQIHVEWATPAQVKGQGQGR